MGKKTRKQTKKRGGGYTMPYGYYNTPGYPTFVNPFATILSTNSTSNMIRPELPQTGGMTQTIQKGGSKKLKGGFSPTIMGGFIPNAQAAIVPLALYTVYHTLVPKKTRKNK